MLKKLFDHFSAHVTIWTWAWPYLASVVGAGALTGYLAHATEWIKPWGPIGWWALALAGALVVVLLSYVSSIAYLKIVDARIRRKVFAASDRINHLDTLFDGKKIHIVDLAYPFMPIVENKVFQDCDLIGPMNVLFAGNTTVTNCVGELNQAAVIQLDNIRIPFNTIVFVNCTIRRCRIYQTTMFVTEDIYERFAANWNNLPWITRVPDKLTNPPV